MRERRTRRLADGHRLRVQRVLMSAIGAGAIAGALGTGLLAPGRDLGRWEGTGTALSGLPLLAIAALPEPAVALVALAIRELGAGDGFGEVALVERCRRTAAVRSLGGLVVRAIEREDFATAVTGHRPTAAEAEAVVSAVREADARRVRP